MTSLNYLYLLVHEAGDAFKIGVSITPARRAKALPDPIDLHRSLQYRAVAGDAYRAEKALHYFFRDYAVERPFGDGYTEWFKITALPEVLRFCSENLGLLGLAGPEAVVVPVSALSDPQDHEAQRLRSLERSKRQSARETNKALRYAHAQEHNAAVLRRVEVALSELESRGAFDGFLLLDMNGSLVLPVEEEAWVKRMSHSVSCEYELVSYRGGSGQCSPGTGLSMVVGAFA